MSLVALVPAGQVMAPDSETSETEPVLVQVTVCRAHVREVRRWLRTRMHEQDEVMTLGTEHLLRHWGQIVESVKVPVFAPATAHSA